MRFTVFSILLLVGASWLAVHGTDYLVDRQFAESTLRISDVDALDGLVGKELTRIPTKAELRKMYNTKAKVDAGIKSLFAGR